MRIAVTGGTGFLGGHVLRVAAERGHAIAALTRRAQLPRPNVEWVPGTLEDARALMDLVEGADAVIHIAGVINAPTLAGFVEGNVTGTATLATACEGVGVKRFIHVSSLSAREPDLSNYGWSKAASEAMLRQSSLDWTIVRPPAIHGPGDREMLELFRLAKKGFVPLPPRGRLSIIAAQDLARLLIDLITAGETIDQMYEPDDGAATGYGHREFGKMLGEAVGNPRVIALPVPQFALRLGALYEEARRGPKAKLTRDRVAYFCHPDWVSAKRPPASLWTPELPGLVGLKATAEAYRKEGWL
ncbi:SDR family oxidoreductase [Sphingomonas crocodyli]|uniref:NAD-dependent epimerase/dehydratase family protein n=1 Tax=Sphingomonas crocodyli TaxID=1979270 RepID=A0A437M6I7_9SPHN|nr:NAD(P)H-binding protein [Sphingomonas crocodyli]RVT93328.1 NAD-dependent epimerase/dehydratase family protein [Sphingomonas crocodyli]